MYSHEIIQGEVCLPVFLEYAEVFYCRIIYYLLTFLAYASYYYRQYSLSLAITYKAVLVGDIALSVEFSIFTGYLWKEHSCKSIATGFIPGCLLAFISSRQHKGFSFFWSF